MVAGIAAVMVPLVVWLLLNYLRDTAELSPAKRVLLLGLRAVALAGIVLFFLGPERRFDQSVTRQSVLAVLVDTSQSMSVKDETTAEGSKESRSESVSVWLADPQTLGTLSSRNDVQLFTFGTDAKPLTSLDRGEPAPAEMPWLARLEPLEGETRLGEAIDHVRREITSQPLAGLVVLTDGRSNRGTAALDVLQSFEPSPPMTEGTPVFTIGLGSDEPRRNARIAELVLPTRTMPGDQITASVIVLAEGLEGETGSVELRTGGSSDAGDTGTLIGSQSIVLPADGQTVKVDFILTPKEEPSKLRVAARVLGPSSDIYPQDDTRTAAVEVVSSRSKVLLVASAATRDYRYLRNLLYRDPQVELSVWLQHAQGAISQDADTILNAFPATAEELFAYDCIVAFDPDWTLLDAEQIGLLDDWVAEEAGGLIVIAGPVHTSTWSQNDDYARIRSLYPVQFQKRLGLLDDGVYGSPTAWPLEFTEAGRSAPFLRLADTQEESRACWDRFPGVFGCYAVRGAKPGAQVLARFSDPDAGLSAERPVYLAEQFYGSGRVFYAGSGEWWRLRGFDPSWFEVLYTKLLRHVSQGRLLRGSSLGVLQLSKDEYQVGENAVVRARLSTPDRQPLNLPSIPLTVIAPDDSRMELKLLADPDRAGNYLGQFPVLREGEYQAVISLPGSSDEPLVRSARAARPDLELADTRRDEPLLVALAERTGGHYFPSPQIALTGGDGSPKLGDLLVSRAETRVVRGKPDKQYALKVRSILLGVIVGALILEWLLRRLMKLA